MSANTTAKPTTPPARIAAALGTLGVWVPAAVGTWAEFARLCDVALRNFAAGRRDRDKARRRVRLGFDPKQKRDGHGRFAADGSPIDERGFHSPVDGAPAERKTWEHLDGTDFYQLHTLRPKVAIRGRHKGKWVWEEHTRRPSAGAVGRPGSEEELGEHLGEPLPGRPGSPERLAWGERTHHTAHHKRPLDPRELWTAGLPGGEAPPEVDWRPTEVTPEDFYAR